MTCVCMMSERECDVDASACVETRQRVYSILTKTLHMKAISTSDSPSYRRRAHQSPCSSPSAWPAPAPPCPARLPSARYAAEHEASSAAGSSPPASAAALGCCCAAWLERRVRVVSSMGGVRGGSGLGGAPLASCATTSASRGGPPHSSDHGGGSLARDDGDLFHARPSTRNGGAQQLMVRVAAS